MEVELQRIYQTVGNDKEFNNFYHKILSKKFVQTPKNLPVKTCKPFSYVISLIGRPQTRERISFVERRKV